MCSNGSLNARVRHDVLVKRKAASGHRGLNLMHFRLLVTTLAALASCATARGCRTHDAQWRAVSRGGCGPACAFAELADTDQRARQPARDSAQYSGFDAILPMLLHRQRLVHKARAGTALLAGNNRAIGRANAQLGAWRRGTLGIAPDTGPQSGG